MSDTHYCPIHCSWSDSSICRKCWKNEELVKKLYPLKDMLDELPFSSQDTDEDEGKA